MDVVQRDHIDQLVERRSGPCISIYLPTFRAGVDTLQNPIRFKNQLREAERRLVELNLRSVSVREMLGPMRDLVDQYEFWQHQSDGLAMFRSGDFYCYFRVPVEFDELVVVADRFHLKPLLRLFAWDGNFYVLALSRNSVRMLECTRYRVDELELPEAVPGSLAEVAGVNVGEDQLQVHSVGQGPGGGRTGVFHGHRGGGEMERVRLAQYFREIDRGLRDVLRDERAPLVLAGVDYLFPIYRSVNTYPGLVAAGVPGNVEGIGAEELHRKALEIVEPLFAENEKRAAAEYRRRSLEGRASTQIGETLRAAHHGRVELLFVAAGSERWGRFDPATEELELHDEPAAGDEDLLDLAAVQTVLGGGTVFPVEPGRVPDGKLLAAAFRY
jgi:hypothetical protein